MISKWFIQTPAIGRKLRSSIPERRPPYCFLLWKKRVTTWSLLSTRYRLFTLVFYFLHFILVLCWILLVLVTFFYTFRRPTLMTFWAYSTLLEVLWLEPTIKEIFRSILFSSFSPFSLIILHFMYCVLLIISWKFCHYLFLIDPKDSPMQVSTPAYREAPPGRPRLGQRCAVWYQYQDYAWITHGY